MSGTFSTDEKIDFAVKSLLQLTTKYGSLPNSDEGVALPRVFPISIRKDDIIKNGVGDLEGKEVDVSAPWGIVQLYKIIDPIVNKVSNVNVGNILTDNTKSGQITFSDSTNIDVKMRNLVNNNEWDQYSFYSHWYANANANTKSSYPEDKSSISTYKGIRLAYSRATSNETPSHDDIVPHISLYLHVKLTLFSAGGMIHGDKDTISFHRNDQLIRDMLGPEVGFDIKLLADSETPYSLSKTGQSQTSIISKNDVINNSTYGAITLFTNSPDSKYASGDKLPRLSYCRYIGDTVDFENIGGGASIKSGFSEPTNADDGDLFINTNDKILKRYDGSQWASIGGSGGGGSGTVSYFRDLNDLALFDNSGYLYYNHDNKDFPLGVKDLSELFRLSEMLVVNDAGQTFFEVLTEQPRFFQDNDTVFQNMVFGEDYIDIHWTYDRILPRGAVSNAFQHYFSLFGTPKMTLPVINKIVYEVYISSYFINKRFEVICNRNYNDYDEFKTIRITYQQINDIIVDELGIQEFDILIYGVNNNNNYPSELAQDGVNVEQNLRCIRLNQVRFVNTDNALSFDSKIYVDGEWKIQILNTNSIRTVEFGREKDIDALGTSQSFQNSENDRKENMNLRFVWYEQKFFDLMDGIENVEHHYINLYTTLQNSKRCKRIYPIDKGEKVTRIYHRNKRLFDQNTGLLLADASKNYYTVSEDNTLGNLTRTVIDISLNNNFLNLGSRYDVQIVIRTTYPYYMITNKSDILHLDYTDPPIITPLNNIETQIQNFYSDYVYFREENMTNRTYTINYQKAFRLEATEPSYILISPHKDHDNTALITSNIDDDTLNIIIEGETYDIDAGNDVTTIDYRFNSYTDYGYNNNDNGMQIIQNGELIEKYPVINLLDNTIYDYNNFVVVERIWYRDGSNIYMKLNTDISNIINKDVSFTIYDNISRTSKTFDICTNNIEYNINNKYDVNDEKYDEDPNYKHYIIKIDLDDGWDKLKGDENLRENVDINIYWKFGFEDISNETHEGVKYILNNTEINDGAGEDLTVRVNVSTDVNKGEDLLKQVDIYDLTMNMDQYNAKITFNGFDVDSISTVTDIFVSDANDYDPHVNKQIPHPADPTVMINFDDEKRQGFHLDGQFKLNINRLIEQNEIINPMKFDYSYDKWNGLKESNRSWNNIFNIDTNDKFPNVYYKRNEIITDNDSYRTLFGNKNLLKFNIKSYRIYENINSKFLENTQYEDVYLNFHSRRFDGFGRQKSTEYISIDETVLLEQNIENPTPYDISNSMQIIPGNKNLSIDAINENNIYGTLTQKLKLQTNKPVELIKSLNVFKFDEDIELNETVKTIIVEQDVSDSKLLIENYFNDENTVNYLNDISGFFKLNIRDGGISAWNMWELSYNVFNDNNFMNTEMLDISCSDTNNYLKKYVHYSESENISICEKEISSNLFPIYINKGLHTISTMKHTDPEGIIDDKSKIFINEITDNINPEVINIYHEIGPNTGSSKKKIYI